MPAGRGTWRIRPGAAWAALAVVLSGCAKPPDYPPNLTFPTRADRLVLKLPESFPTRIGNPDEQDRDIARLDALGGRTLDPTSLPEDVRKQLDAALAELFGKPASPTLPGEDAGQLAEGGKLYRYHCRDCHGMTGDGRGPTGTWLHPHPRDFRRGLFKFTTTGDGAKPRRADILRTIREGLKGTAMPAFAQMPEHDRALIAGYVAFLSVRGQVEYQTLQALLDPDGDGADDVLGFARSRLAVLTAAWEVAERSPLPTIPPELEDREHPEQPEAARRGYELFASAGCAACHEDFGRKDTFRYDIWGNVVRVANLTGRDRKGGGTAADVFHRVRGGIGPSGMPSHGSLPERQVLDLVRFVRALPYPRELPPDVRAKVYPGTN